LGGYFFREEEPRQQPQPGRALKRKQGFILSKLTSPIHVNSMGGRHDDKEERRKFGTGKKGNVRLVLGGDGPFHLREKRIWGGRGGGEKKFRLIGLFVGGEPDREVC